MSRDLGVHELDPDEVDAGVAPQANTHLGQVRRTGLCRERSGNTRPGGRVNLNRCCTAACDCLGQPPAVELVARTVGGGYRGLVDGGDSSSGAGRQSLRNRSIAAFTKSAASMATM